MRILLVEDAAKTGAYLQQGLTEAGFVVDWARDGQAGLVYANDNAYDVIVLDVMLPQIDGWQVLQRLRAVGVRTPVLFLSARDAIEDRVKGLELGAEDYLVKPFSFAELLARIRTILRRQMTNLVSPSSRASAVHPVEVGDQGVLRIADLELDWQRRSVQRAGQRIEVTAKELALLAFFMRRVGEVLPRSLIASSVWDINFDSDTNVIDVAVRRLRMKVDEGYTPKLIHTVRGMGYRMEVQDAS